MEKRFKAIIFDLGNVIIDVSIKKAFQHWAKIAKYSLDDLIKKFPQNSTFEKFERGEINSHSYRNHIRKQINLNISDKEFDVGWNKILIGVSPGINKLLVSLKNNYRLVALTNTNEIHAPVWKSKFKKTLKNFEKIFCSNEIHFRKPESKAYQIPLDYLQEEPEKVVFLDDKEINVTKAVKLGMCGILVENFEKMMFELNRKGIF